VLQVIDFKYGQGIFVEAQDNPQMKLYALGALELFENLYDITDVSMTIYQPRRENVSTWTIAVSELKAWASGFLVPRAILAYSGEGDYSPGEWCTFCKAAVKCRARADTKLKLAAHEFTLPPLLKDEEIEDILPRLDDLTKWAADILEYAANAAIKSGKQWNGYKIVEGRSVRKYMDEAAVAKAAMAAGYKDIYKKSLLALTEMERLMGKEQFSEVLGSLVQKQRGKLTLVPESDKRQAIDISDVTDDFKEDL
jgi:predicted CopG family antitoxin